MMGLGISSPSSSAGLMLLIFYSSRAGYDEAPQIEYDDETEEVRSPRPPRVHGPLVPISSGRNSKQRGDKQQHDKATRIRA